MANQEHPSPATMATEAYATEACPFVRDDPGQTEAMVDRVRARAVQRSAFASGVAAERERLLAILRNLDKGDWLPGRLRALVASLGDSLPPVRVPALGWEPGGALPVEETPDPTLGRAAIAGRQP